MTHVTDKVHIASSAKDRCYCVETDLSLYCGRAGYRMLCQKQNSLI
jgi:hypothetical protein